MKVLGPDPKIKEREKKRKETTALIAAAQHSIQSILGSAAPTPTKKLLRKQAGVASRRITERAICHASSYTTGPPPRLRLHSNRQSRHTHGHAGEEEPTTTTKATPPTLLTAVIVATEATVHVQPQEALMGSRSSRRRPKEGNDVEDDATARPYSRI